eukprot:1158535-Pelagomonas_calceolata.AAC.6
MEPFSSELRPSLALPARVPLMQLPVNMEHAAAAAAAAAVRCGKRVRARAHTHTHTHTHTSCTQRWVKRVEAASKEALKRATKRTLLSLSWQNLNPFYPTLDMAFSGVHGSPETGVASVKG